MKRFGFQSIAALAVAAVLAVSLQAADKAPNIRITKPNYNPEHETIELFAGMEDGSLEVRLIPRNSKEGRILVHNKTGKPVNVQLPEAFVGVLAQGPGGGLFGGGQQGGGQGGGQQGVGGGGQQGGGLGLGNIPPDRVGEFRVPLVCLEHGKDEPKSTIKYDIKPVEAFSDDPALKELLKLYGTGEISQPVAQIVAWHIADKMSFQELAAKEIKRLNGNRYPYFDRNEVLAAVRLMEIVKERVKELEKTPKASPGEKLTTAR